MFIFFARISLSLNWGQPTNQHTYRDLMATTTNEWQFILNAHTHTPTVGLAVSKYISTMIKRKRLWGSIWNKFLILNSTSHHSQWWELTRCETSQETDAYFCTKQQRFVAFLLSCLLSQSSCFLNCRDLHALIVLITCRDSYSVEILCSHNNIILGYEIAEESESL